MGEGSLPDLQRTGYWTLRSLRSQERGGTLLSRDLGAALQHGLLWRHRMPRPRGGVGGGVLDTRNGSLLPGIPQAGALTRPLSHSPEPGDEGDPGRSGLELEPEEPPGWRELVPLGTLHSLPKSQVKRQEVISGEYPGHHPILAKRPWSCPSPQSLKAACFHRGPFVM